MNPLGWLTVGRTFAGVAGHIRQALAGDLNQRLYASAEKWSTQLPSERSVKGGALVRFLHDTETQGPRDARESVFDILRDGGIPTEDQWLDALLEQWRDVRSTYDEPQDFFAAEEKAVREDLAGLAKLFHRELAEDTPSFQRQTTQHLENLTSDLAEIKGRLLPQAAPAGLSLEIKDIVAYTKSGQAQISLDLLNRYEQASWTSLDEEQRLALRFHQANALLELGKYDQAAEAFERCAGYAPDSPGSRVAVALASLTSGRRELAQEQAQAILDEHPDHGLAVSVLVASSSDSLEEIAGKIPPILLRNAEVALALSHKALSEDSYATAEQFARAAVAAEPNWRPALDALSCSLLGAQLESSRNTPLHPRSAVDNASLTEALEHLDRSLQLLSPETSPEVQAMLRLRRALALDLLGRHEESALEVHQTHLLCPSDSIAAARYAAEMSMLGKHDEAIQLLRSLCESSNTPDNAYVLLATALVARGLEGDSTEAYGLLLQRVQSDTTTRHSDEELELLAEVSVKADRVSHALDVVKARGPDLLSGVLHHALIGLLALEQGDEAVAASEAKLADASLTAATPYLERIRLARLLESVGDASRALVLWEQLLPHDAVVPDTIAALSVAARSGNDGFMLRLGRSLRDRNVLDRRVLDFELAALERASNFGLSLQIIDRFLSESPDDKLFVLRRSLLAIRARRFSEIESRPERLPALNEVDAHVGRAVAHVLSYGPDPLRGVTFAYELIRKFPDHRESHIALLMQLLPPRRTTVSFPTYDAVAPGTAFVFKHLDSGQVEWRIIEEREPKASLGEIPADSVLAKEVIGLRIGDTFDAAPQGLQPLPSVIVAIRDKRQQRYRESLDNYHRLFPGEDYVQPVQLPPDWEERAEESLRPLLDSVDSRRSRILELEASYVAHDVFSIPLFAKVAGRTVYETYGFLCHRPDIPIKCCQGNSGEGDSAALLLDAGATVFLDRTAIASALLHQIPLASLGHYVVSESAVQELRDYLTLNPPGERAVIGKSDQGYTLTEVTSDADRDQLLAVSELATELEGHCSLETGLHFEDIDDKLRAGLERGLAPCEVDTILLCRAAGGVLWTDDRVVAQSAAELGVAARVWTQEVTRRMVRSGALTTKQGIDIVLRLLQYRVRHTLFDADVFSQAASISSWNPSILPLAEAIDYFSNPRCNDSTIGSLTLLCLKRIWRACPTSASAEAILRAILDRLSQRNGGDTLISAIANSLDVAFGVDVLAAAGAKRVFDDWRRSRDHALILPPWLSL